MADEIIGLGGRIEALSPQMRRLRAAWKLDRLLLPLSADGAVVDHILAGIFYDKDLLRG